MNTTANGRGRAACADAIDGAVLMDYWLALLPQADEDRVEQHLMTCDHCGDRLRETIALADGLRGLARSGALRVVVSERFVQHAAGAGQRVREYAVSPGDSVPCTVSPVDDLLIARLAADLRGAARVDLRFFDAGGVELRRLTDIPVRDDAGGVIYQESMTFAKAAPTHTLITRLVAVDAAGAERLLGEYTFNHTRMTAGPADREKA
jgi:hypothetical protein